MKEWLIEVVFKAIVYFCGVFFRALKLRGKLFLGGKLLIQLSPCLDYLLRK